MLLVKQNIIVAFLWLCSLVMAEVKILLTDEIHPDRKAAFGPGIDENGLFGVLSMYSSDPFLCGPSSVPSMELMFNWIALAERGNCPFAEKVRLAQKLNAVAVIVGDPIRNALITMNSFGDTSDIKIPAVFVGRNSYLDLRRLAAMLAAHGAQLEVQLTPDFNDDLGFPWPIFDILLLILFSPLLMIFFIYVAWKMRLACRHRMSRIASKDTIHFLPVKVYYNVKRLPNDPQECAICLEDFSEEEELRVLPCKHEFHVYCIDPWLLQRKKVCPVCKRDVAPTESTSLLSSRSISNNV